MDRGYAILMSFAVIVLIVAAVLILMSPVSTSIDNISEESLSNGQDFAVKLTEYGIPIKNQSIVVTFKDANNESNSMILTTDSKGIAKIVLGGVTPGNYTVECSYSGDNAHCNTSLITSVEVIG